MKKIIATLLALPLAATSIPAQASASQIHLNDGFQKPIQQELIVAQRSYRRVRVPARRRVLIPAHYERRNGRRVRIPAHYEYR